MAIHIRDVEKRLFSYLFLNKVANSCQVLRDIYPKITHQALYKRLNRLIAENYLDANYDEELRGRLVYSLSAKAMNEFILGKSSKGLRQQLKSNSILHDLDLVDVRSKMKSLNQVETYFSENLIQSGVELADRESLKPFLNFRFDAILKVKKGDKVFLPMEYERTLKFSSRYNSYFKKLYSNPDVSALLFVTRDNRLSKKIQSFERAVLGERWPKVFYCELERVKIEVPVTFLNLNGERLSLE